MNAQTDPIIDRLCGDWIPRNWTFENEKVAEGFDRHVREQLPFYDMATGAIAHLARHYVPQGGLVYDIGASTGNIARAIGPTLDDRKAQYIGIEESQQMADKWNGPGQCIVADAIGYDYKPFDFAVLFLVVMFLPVAERGRWLADLVKKMRPGGAIVIFDKVLPERGYPGTVMRRLTLAGKVASGTSAAEIVGKELSLGGVQRPINETLLTNLPGRAVEFLRFGEFAGWFLENGDSN
jgi:tRNA (cmo5U34)-methyltransferase